MPLAVARGTAWMDSPAPNTGKRKLVGSGWHTPGRGTRDGLDGLPCSKYRKTLARRGLGAASPWQT